ncbi:hypothetical protein FISHEDRAFT_73612 [Fistulina hepatica ATCC 64428]|uniref:O-methyltransferase dimerisation domain-containing protein n=1 Tax=Fistulina hepatica ATCC 64428 TaxID=1128425 RepID=A0A0D7AC52_9AGAR|nr:hypothetical protein FISHEDRAFT_73612 [Fistulina hepatica ATCC 64428]
MVSLVDSSPKKAPSLLRQLADLISASVDKIDAIFEEKGLEYPSLFSPIDGASPAEAAARDPHVMQVAAVVVAACSQLGATLHVPIVILSQAALSYHIPSALRFAIETDCADILRGQDRGLHVGDIASVHGVDASRLGRCLRLLAGHHIFKEACKPLR